MNIFDKKQTMVIDQEAALKVYFDALLQDMSGFESISAPGNGFENEEILEKHHMPEPVEKTPGQAVSSLIVPQQAKTLPDWATASFQGLLFSVNGLKLAVPLIKLHSIVNWTDTIKPIPGYASWFMGLLSYRGENVKVIDIAKLMAVDGAESAVRAGVLPKKVLLINDGTWGFTCDDISQIITLYPDQIQWRIDRTRRTWLLGTIIDSMCSLLDVDQFAFSARIMPVN